MARARSRRGSKPVSHPPVPMVAPLVTAMAALAVWLLPIPAPVIERWYSRGVYITWQRISTAVSNLAPFALFDLLLIAGGVLAAVVAIRAARSRSFRHALRGALLLGGLAALWFQGAWGLNYRRVPLAESMRLETAAQPDGALRRFAAAAAAAAAATAGDLDRDNPLTPSRVLADLSSGFMRAQQKTGLAAHARPARPKRSLFDFYFRWAAIDGLTNPFVPETIVVSGLTPGEAYVTVAHEWAHLAGYASEDEAGFVAWLACLEAGGGARYNAWLFALVKAAEAAPRETGRTWLARAGPVAARDLAAMRARAAAASPAIRRAASSTYDRFLRANRVESGIGSYDEVLRLMLAYDTGR